MRREKLIFVVVLLVCSFIGGRAFAVYELQKPNWCVVDCGLNDTIGTGDYANGLDTGDVVGCRLDCSIGPLGEVHWLAGTILVESGFYHINYSSWIANPTFVFNDIEISSTTIRFKLDTGSNPDWTQYAIAFSTATLLNSLFKDTTYYIKEDGSWGTSFDEAKDWNPASFYEGVELTSLKPNTIYGFKIKSKSSPEPPTLWSGKTENYTWTHIETPGINVKVYITSATVTAVGPFTNLGWGQSGIYYGIGGSWPRWNQNDTPYTFTGLTPNTSYTFKVKASNGAWYETEVVSVDKCTLCARPQNPYITEVSSCSLRLDWSKPSSGTAEYYKIKENEVPIQDNYIQLSLSRDNLESVNSRYTYKIYAVNKSSDTDENSLVSISTYTFCSIPPAPQIVDISADTINMIIKTGNNPSYTEYSIKAYSVLGPTKFVENDYTVGDIEVFHRANEWGEPLKIKNLGSNVKYDISVQAMNVNGHVTGYGASVSSCTYAAVPGLEVVEEDKLAGWVKITIQQGNNSPETEYAIWVDEKSSGGMWSPKGWLQPDSNDPVWRTKSNWEEGQGFIEITGLNLDDNGFRFKAKGRRTITGYSTEETVFSKAFAYAGNVVYPPTAKIGLVELTAETTYYYNSDQTVTFGAGEIHYSYTTDGSPPPDPTRSNLLGTSFTLTAPQGSVITYKIKAKAWNGDAESDVGGVWVVVIDREPPTIGSFIIQEGEYTRNPLITLRISAENADSMWIDGDVVDDINTKKWIDYSGLKIVYLRVGDGAKTVNLKVKDKAGNEASPESDTITLEQFPPAIVNLLIDEAISTDRGVFVTTTSITLRIVAENANSMRIYGDVVNDINTKKWIDYGTSEQVTLTPGDGEKTVTVTIKKDTTGSTDEQSANITLDTVVQNPTLSLSDQDSTNQEYTNSRTVNIFINNLNADIVEYILGEIYQTRPDPNNPAWGNLPVADTFFLSSGEGEKKVYMWVKDAVGNINVGISSATITLDTQGPRNPSLSIDEGNYTNLQMVHLTISATEANNMLIDGDVKDDTNTKGWISYSSSTQVTVLPGDGEKEVTVKFKDEAGNETSIEKRTITLDTIPPAIEGNIEARFVRHNEELEERKETGCQTPTFIWKATDTLSGVNGYSYSFSTDTGVEPNDVIDPTTKIESLDSIQPEWTDKSKDGTYYFKVKAKDYAGNFSQVSSFTYEYRADLVYLEATIEVEGKERQGDEVKGVKANTLPEIEFNKEVWGVRNNVEVELIRDNEGKEYENRTVSCEISSSTVFLWKANPEKDWESNHTYRIKVKDNIEDKTGNRLMEEKELIFTTMLDRTKRNVVMWESEKKTEMILEANALEEDGYILINLEPLSLKETGAKEAKQVNKDAIIEADKKVKNNGDRYCYNLRESMKEISGYNTEGGKMVGEFSSDVYVEFPYGDEDNDGIVDSTKETSEPVSEKTLSIYWLDEERKLWVKVSGTEVDKEKNVARAKVIGFGTYTLMGGGFYDLSDAYAYPVPYKPNDGLSTTGDETTGIRFTNLSTEAEIRIYTISGELVKKLVHKSGYVEEWYPVENEKGEKVVSGVYIYYIENQKQHKLGKLVIIR
jgi:hypothetical protein